MSDLKNVLYLEIAQIQPNPLQPRGLISSESLGDLINSIKQHGVLEPLIVAHTPAGYQIIAGERRWRASKIAGLDTVPVVVKETSPKGMLEMALVENVQREDLNALERAKAFQKLLDEYSLTKDDVARRIGKSIPYVTNTLNLLNLPDALKDGLLSGLIAEGHARALLAIREPRLIIEVYKIVLKESASVRRAEDLARRFKAKANIIPPEGPSSLKDNRHIISEETDKIQKEIQQSLGKKSKVKLIRSNRQTKLSINLKGNLSATDDILKKIHQLLITLKQKSIEN